jgi:prepilin-type N-terminal cleavage/methylation domain-containing protein
VKTNRGFSLLELLIVVAIILIVSMIAVPSFLRSRQTANENAAVAALRTLSTAELTYSSGNGGVYGNVSDLIANGLVDSRYAPGMSGYTYTIALSPDGMDYTGVAVAGSAYLGRYDFYVLPDFVIRYSSDSTRAPIGLAGLPVQN